jgi:hypothetical protein
MKAHHVNIAMLPEHIDAEKTFLVDVFGMAELDAGEFASQGAIWYQCGDTIQLHLSADPDFIPSARAHVALDLGDDMPDVEARLAAGGYEHFEARNDTDRRVFVTDPGGNRWELRDDSATR